MFPTGQQLIGFKKPAKGKNQPTLEAVARCPDRWGTHHVDRKSKVQESTEWQPSNIGSSTLGHGEKRPPARLVEATHLAVKSMHQLGVLSISI